MTVLFEHPAPSSIPPSRVTPAIVAKQLNELGKVRVQTEGFRDATDVVMGPSVVICTRLAMQRYKVLTAGNLGTWVGAVFNAVEVNLFLAKTLADRTINSLLPYFQSLI